MKTKYLPIYLSDHSAMMTGELELIDRVINSNRKSNAAIADEVATYLMTVKGDVEQQQMSALQLLKKCNSGPSPIKEVGAWVAEKLGRLKLNGQLTGYSHLSRILEIEALILAAEGRRLLWRTLEPADDEQRQASQFVEQTSEHIERLRELHRAVTQIAFPIGEDGCETSSAASPSTSV